MKGLKIFLAWILTVIIGSIFLPIIPMAFAGGDVGSDGLEMVFLFMFVGALISGAASLPTIIVLLIVHAVNLEKENRLRSVNIAHVCMAMATIVVGSLWVYFEFKSDMGSFGFVYGGAITIYIAVVIFYAIVAFLVWYFLFRKEYKAAKLSDMNSDSQILDDPQVKA